MICIRFKQKFSRHLFKIENSIGFTLHNLSYKGSAAVLLKNGFEIEGPIRRLL